MVKNQKYLFNLKNDIHYLNCAYKAPLLKSAEDAAIKALTRARNPVDIHPVDFFNDSNEVRTLFGQIINCTYSEIALIPSTSYGFSSILNNIPCAEGQHAITIDKEFPSNYYSIKRWCDTHNASLKIIKPNQQLAHIAHEWNTQIIESINEHTALVIMTSVYWTNGLKFDLQKIGAKCKSVGARFIVDGTQSVGVLPIDVKKFHIDALVCAGYKWLFGPYSLCLAYMGEAFNNGIPIEEAWLNRTNALDFDNLTNYDPNYKPNAGRFNVGETSNFILMPMLKQALIQVNSWLASDVQSYMNQLIEPLLIYLKTFGLTFESNDYFSPHLFKLKLPPEIDLDLLKKNLAKHKVYLSVRGNYLRVSVHVFNTHEDINKLIEVIEETRCLYRKVKIKLKVNQWYLTSFN